MQNTAQKELFVLVQSGGDGSYSPRFTMNKDWIEAQQALYDKGELDWEAAGIDGDGFHYEILLVPDNCTLESMGVSDCAN